MEKFGPIDLVYKWVDGSSPLFAAQLEKFKRRHAEREGAPPSGVAAGPQRFRDLDNLRYSLRSVAKNAPWLNRIFIVTNGQSPRWLDKSSGIRIVRHEEIFSNLKYLPTFNSSAIDTQLHRIPGLSRFFIYMDDDFFFSRPVEAGYFFGKNGLSKLMFSSHIIDIETKESSIWLRKLARLARLMNERFGVNPWLAGAHGPMLFDKTELEKVFSIWSEDAELTSQRRFRSAADLQFQTVYTNTVSALDEQSKKPEAERHELVILTEPELRIVSVGAVGKGWRGNLEEVLENPPTLLCLNDNAPSDLPEAEALDMEKTHRAFLEKMFPEPSPYERQ